MKCIVLGAGVIGTTIAYELARDGHEVVVLERQDDVAQGASHANGGVIGASQVEPWAAPGMPRNLIRWLGRDDAPLLVRPGELPSVWSWGLRFLSSCTARAFDAATRASLRLALYSLERLAVLRSEIPGIDIPGGQPVMKIFTDPTALAKTAANTERWRPLGFPARVLSLDEARRIEPALLAASDRIVGAVFYIRDESRDCAAFTSKIAQAAREKGVSFRFGAEAGPLTREGDLARVQLSGTTLPADAIVAALGSWTPAGLANLGFRLPVIPTKGLTITVPAAPWPQAPKGALIDTSRIFGLVRLGDSLRISGTAEIAGFDAKPDRRRTAKLAASVAELFPAFERCLEAERPRVWAGLRPTTPDGPPIIGATPIRNLWIATGHGPQGWTGACGTARIVADLVSGREAEIDLNGLTLARFS
jgi:D-amino-acid dehydrogenase